MTLNENLIEAKNLLHSSNAWVTLVHVAISGGDNMRVACNVSSNITWGGYKWTALSVIVGVIREDKQEIPQIEVKICNVNKVPETYAQTNDGLIGSQITFYEVHTDNLLETENIPTYSMEIVGASYDSLWAYYTLGINPNPMEVSDPIEKIHKNFCRFGYPNSKDERCPYTADVYSSCPRTLAACITRNGDTVAKRYGGFPAIGTNRIYVNQY